MPADKRGIQEVKAEHDSMESIWEKILQWSEEGWDLDAFVTGDQVVDVALRILDVFHENGQHEKRNKARMKFLIDEWGMERFRQEVLDRLSFEPEPAGEDLTRHDEGYRDHVGVHPQKDGNYYVGLCAPTGRVKLDRVYELCRLAEEYGDGEIRLTTYQNPIIPNVPEERLDELLNEPLLRILTPYPGPFVRGLITCTGKSFCPFALIETKDRGLELAEYLDEKLGDRVQEELGVFRIHVSGCVNSCARPHAGEIGMIGKQVKQDGKVVEAANVMLGGDQGLWGDFNEQWEKKVPFEEMAPQVEEIITRYLDERGEGESFREWVIRTELISVPA